jgi:hypothetical protein
MPSSLGTGRKWRAWDCWVRRLGLLGRDPQGRGIDACSGGRGGGGAPRLESRTRRSQYAAHPRGAAREETHTSFPVASARRIADLVKAREERIAAKTLAPAPAQPGTRGTAARGTAQRRSSGGGTLSSSTGNGSGMLKRPRQPDMPGSSSAPAPMGLPNGALPPVGPPPPDAPLRLMPPLAPTDKKAPKTGKAPKKTRKETETEKIAAHPGQKKMSSFFTPTGNGPG